MKQRPDNSGGQGHRALIARQEKNNSGPKNKGRVSKYARAPINIMWNHCSYGLADARIVTHHRQSAKPGPNNDAEYHDSELLPSGFPNNAKYQPGNGLKKYVDYSPDRTTGLKSY